MKAAPPVRPAHAVEAPSITGDRKHSHIPSRVMRGAASLFPFRVSEEGAGTQNRPDTSSQQIAAE